jgi:hypothetical protein
VQPAPPPTPPRLGRTRAGLAVAAVALAVALGAVLRLADPLSSPVVPAEDPYTHMALVREHLRTGDLDPLNGGEAVYPPGLHGFMAAAAVLTGADLYRLTLYGPVVLGAIGVLGVGILLWRTAGPVAGIVGALGLAVAPEAIFRTTMMSPTALDLAVLPFFLYALLRVLAGRLGWAGVAAPTAVFLALAHPWLLAILCAAGALFLLAALVLPWPAARGEPLSRMGAAACVAVLGGAFGVALAMPTFGFVLPLPGGVELVPIGIAVGILALAPVALLALWPRARAWSRAQPVRRTHVLVRVGLSAAIAATLLATVAVATRQGMPQFVDLPRMVGWPLLGLAFAALVALPFLSSPVANLAASIAAATLPFVLFNPLHSEFLPHRTAVFLGFALALLAGVAAGAAARAVSHAASRAAQALGRARPGPAASTPWGTARPILLATLPALFVTMLLGGTVYAGTPDAYEGGWYRLYNACEMDAFRDLAAQADANPDALFVTGDWQAKLVLASMASDSRRVWYTGDAFSSAERRETLVAQADHDGRPLVLVVDRYLRVETPEARTNFLTHDPWQPDGEWCANMGVPQPRVTAFTTGGLE